MELYQIAEVLGNIIFRLETNFDSLMKHVETVDNIEESVKAIKDDIEKAKTLKNEIEIINRIERKR